MELTSEQKKEIQEQQLQNYSTKRVTSPELEKVLYEAIPVLDHGFIRVIDYMGDDSSIVQSARVSYGKGTKKVSTDEGLIRYLMRHWHSTPFEM
ncbi:MAG: thymidylate synthase (FAD), partial [Candidatus Fonsibacter ubiquis]|nr:thymidylate synthase (FAD) [Candidatus Fonsibacter ubiquis]